MEVSGKLAAGGPQLFCHPCYRGDNSLQSAYGFCNNCVEHLCESCYTNHKKPLPCRHHVLLENDAMPKIQDLNSFTPCDVLDFCQKHVNERMKFFCNDHIVATCSVCMMDHRLCELVHVPDVAKNITGSGDYQKQVSELNDLREKCRSTRKHASDVMRGSELNLGIISEEIIEIREKINNNLDEMQNKAEHYMNRDKNGIQKMYTVSGEILEEVDQIESSISKLVEQKHFNNLFLEMKQTRDRIKNLFSRGNEVWYSYEMPSMTMTRDEDFLDQLKGKLISTDNKRILTLQCKITISVKELIGKTTSFIDGIDVASTDKLIAIGSDCQNHFVVLVELGRNEKISELELPSEPHDITSMPKNHYAVTVRKGIQILSLEHAHLSADRYLETNEQYYGIAHCQDKFVVSCKWYPGKVMILDLCGTILAELDANGSLYHPKNIAVSNDGRNINVTDGKHTVTQMDWEGKVTSVYREDGCYGPRDIQELADGTFIVCFHGSNKLALMSTKSNMCEISGVSNSDIWKPHALRYCSKSEKLYLLCASGENKFADVIKIFDTKWQ